MFNEKLSKFVEAGTDLLLQMQRDHTGSFYNAGYPFSKSFAEVLEDFRKWYDVQTAIDKANAYEIDEAPFLAYLKVWGVAQAKRDYPRAYARWLRSVENSVESSVEKTLIIHLEIQNGEYTHNHVCIHKTTKKNLEKAVRKYASKFWGKSRRDGDVYFAGFMGELGIRVATWYVIDPTDIATLEKYGIR